jgi:peptidoglycan/LPS O-acetylase OafA/YrhL
MRLATAAQGRDNNFNLIRIVAASLVMVSHSFALSTGSPAAEPLRAPLGITLGVIAVDLFFVASGFLVFGSLVRSQSLLEFAWARTLRIQPALLAMLMLTVFGLGPLYTSEPLSAYLTSPQTHRYLLKCATLFGGVAYELPGVFERNPFPHGVNGSLWTLPYEVRMYAALALLWLVCTVSRAHRARLVEAGVIAAAIVSGALMVHVHFHDAGEKPLPRLAFMFFTGAAYHVFRERIPLSGRLFGVLLASVIAAAFIHRDTFFVVYSLGVAYILFWLAYVPAGWIRGYNRAGDYSYGTYIYAFPVQQAIVAGIPGITAGPLLLASALVTLALAALSWHLLERHALAHKRRCVDWTRKLVGARGA